jgi:Xaa-Pro dipeptidase
MDLYTTNMSKLKGLMSSKGLESLIICGQPNITYFTGIPKPSGTLMLVVGDEVMLLTPLLDYERVSKSIGTRDINVVPYSRYAVKAYVDYVEDLTGYVKKKLSGVSRLGIDLNYINYLIYGLVNALTVDVVDVSGDIQLMRSVKEGYEVEFIRKALRISEEALMRTINELSYGVTELGVVGVLEKFMRDLGADGVAFDTIVASGVNSVYPHALPGNDVIQPNTPVVMDLGATYRSYSSDITRTVSLGRLPDEVFKVFEVVVEALVTAEDFVGPYVKVSEVDRRVREVLSRYGLDKYFIHSTGHGVGIEVHEHPRLAQGVDEVLRPGMVITLEPGVYIPGKFGVRVEDMVLITKSGREVLNKLQHRLLQN